MTLSIITEDDILKNIYDDNSLDIEKDFVVSLFNDGIPTKSIVFNDKGHTNRMEFDFEKYRVKYPYCDVDIYFIPSDEDDPEAFSSAIYRHLYKQLKDGSHYINVNDDGEIVSAMEIVDDTSSFADMLLPEHTIVLMMSLMNFSNPIPKFHVDRNEILKEMEEIKNGI